MEKHHQIKTALPQTSRLAKMLLACVTGVMLSTAAWAQGGEVEPVSVLAAYGLAALVCVIGLGLIAATVRARRLNQTLLAKIDVIQQSKEKLHEVESNLATAQRIAKVGSWSWHIPSGELWWSDEIYRIFGLLPQQFGATYDAFLTAVHPDDRDSVNDAVNTSLQSHKAYSIEHRVVWPDGTERWVHEQGEATYQGQTPIRMSGTVQDITQRKKAEQKIHELNETLEKRVVDRTRDLDLEKKQAENFLSIAGTMILALNKQGQITLINRKGAEVLGYAPEDLIGKDWFKTFIPKGQRVEVHTMFNSVLSGEVPPVGTYENLVETRDKGQRLIRWNNAFVRNDNGDIDGVLTSGEDITEQAANEQALRDAKDEADQANKAKSEFLSNMSHELRTPLNAILGFAQLLETDNKHPLSASQMESLNYILRSGNHLLSLINEILDLARIESGRLSLSLEKVDPDHVFQECLDLTKTLADKRGLSVHSTSCSLDRPVITADYTRLKQVLLNLISNAIKYNREKGSVTLSCEAGRPGFLRIAITDTGNGIPTEMHSELFKPFSRLGQEHGSIEGTGIGLTLTKRLVELMNGRIGFDTSIGRGSTFWVELPLAERINEPAIEAPRPALRAVTPGEPLVLYVEDNPANLRLMDNIIERLDGIHLISAHSAELGLELALAHHPDVIILDINLPGMDGYQALSRLRSFPETRNTPILALSANAMPKDVEKGLKAGFKEYLTKPVKIEVVIAALNRTLEKTISEAGLMGDGISLIKGDRSTR